MRVSAEHPQILVARNGSNLHDVQATLKQPTGSFMAQIVKVKIGNASSYCCALKRFLNGHGCQARENVARDAAWQTL